MKINSPFVKGFVKEIIPRVFAVSIKDRYQRAMLFCRYQEFYESPYLEIRGKFFYWEDFMSLYKEKRKEGIFTYPEDWSGFNIPSKVIREGLDTFDKDKGPYDEIMSKIYYYCEDYPLRFQKPRGRWYLIAANNMDSSTMKHEIAHGLYYTNNEYKKGMNALISKMKANQYNKVKRSLTRLGYRDDKKIIDDEIQAYFATGLDKSFGGNEFKKLQKDFIDIFNTYMTTPK